MKYWHNLRFEHQRNNEDKKEKSGNLQPSNKFAFEKIDENGMCAA